MNMIRGCLVSSTNSVDVPSAQTGHIRRYGEKNGRLTSVATDVSTPLDNCQLETETDTEVWHFLLSSPLDGQQHTLCSTIAETTRDKDATEERELCVLGQRCETYPAETTAFHAS